MAHNRLLALIGRTKRRECAKQLAQRLAILMANPSDNTKEIYSVAVINKRHLSAFRRRTLGQPPLAQLKKLTHRVRNELRTMGHDTLVNFDYVARGGKLYHIGVHAQPIDMRHIVSI